MDTTSNAMSRIMFMLSLHPDVQEKVRAELCDAFQGGGGIGLRRAVLVAVPGRGCERDSEGVSGTYVRVRRLF
jgi:cytochrome P450